MLPSLIRGENPQPPPNPSTAAMKTRQAIQAMRIRNCMLHRPRYTARNASRAVLHSLIPPDHDARAV
jgi:hypothetical protein